MDKVYRKCYLNGNNETPIIAETENGWRIHSFNYKLYCYLKGKDIVTGTPMILLVNEHPFSDEIAMYGYNRLSRIGAICTDNDTISKQEVLSILKDMTEKDAQNYHQAIETAKKRHLEMIKNHIMDSFKKKQLLNQENKELQFQKKRIRNINN